MKNQNEEVLVELKVIKRLLGILITSDKPFKEQVRLLSYAGFGPAEIAKVTGKSANLISVTKNALKEV